MQISLEPEMLAAKQQNSKTRRRVALLAGRHQSHGQFRQERRPRPGRRALDDDDDDDEEHLLPRSSQQPPEWSARDALKCHVKCLHCAKIAQVRVSAKANNKLANDDDNNNDNK